MHIHQAPYRQLYEDLLHFSGATAYESVLAPWAKAQRKEVDWLHAFAKRTGHPFPPATIEDLWRLYALSRVNDLLLLRFQQGIADGCPQYKGPALSLAEYGCFTEELGLQAVSAAKFSPFFHEIVAVEPSVDPSDPVTLLDEYWPALMLGDMIFSRAGAAVRGGSDHIEPQIATSSTLYWAFRRKNRPYQDLSHGWGSNSQWRTRFRRDYRLDGSLHFNVDGKYDLAETRCFTSDRDGLIFAERVELLMNRCFIKTEKADVEPWPYEDRCSVLID
jgi:hypothetical protein